MLDTCLNQILDDNPYPRVPPQVNQVKPKQEGAAREQPQAGRSRDAQEGQADVVGDDAPNEPKLDWNNLNRIVSNRYRDLTVV